MKLVRFASGAMALAGMVCSVACGDDDPEVTQTETQQFRLTIENISGNSALPGPFAPGTFVVHSGDSPLFVAGAADSGQGLEGLAEDGGGVALANAVGGGSFGVPVGETQDGPAFPGNRYEVTFDASDANGTLSFASMLVQSNDLFITNGVSGIPLFDGNGAPIAERDITSLLELWDAGTEINQAPGYGLDQAPRQDDAGQGADEGVIAPFNGPTRALPNASQLVAVSIVDNGTDFTVTVENTSDQASAAMPVAPVFYAAHSAEWSLFTEGAAASTGLEVLAEDGGPMGLVGEHTGAAGTGDVGAQPITVERPSDPPGPSMPGERYQFTVAPTAAFPYVTFAAMAVASNDVFIAPSAAGIRFFDEAGARRAVAEIESDIRAELDLWDAGTEINQVPGVGPDQPLIGGEDIGAADPTVGVRRYRDPTNDLADVANFLSVTVTENAGSFEIVFNNMSGDTAFPSPLTPVAWATHDMAASLFTPGEMASVGIERLAEDGNAMAITDELASANGVGESGFEADPVGGGAAGPIAPGGSYAVTVTPSANARFISFATMVAQSNDAFIGTANGVALLDASGTPRPANMIQSELLAAARIYDAGTEANEPGALGAFQAPRQGMGVSNVGPAEGDGTVRPYDDPIWAIPSLDALVRVTLGPVN